MLHVMVERQPAQMKVDVQLSGLCMQWNHKTVAAMMRVINKESAAFALVGSQRVDDGAAAGVEATAAENNQVLPAVRARR